MIAFRTVVSAMPGCLINTAALLLATAQLAAVILYRRQNRGRSRLVPALFLLLLGWGLLMLLLDCGFLPAYPHSDSIRHFGAAQEWFYRLPWLVFAVGELLHAALLILQGRDILRFRNSRLTPGAIKQTVDLLPSGLCISDEKGVVLLSNLKMEELCRALAGEMLTDGLRFRRQLEERGEKQDTGLLVRIGGNAVWAFSESAISPSGSLRQLTASDMTKPWQITEELAGINRRLTDVQLRMKSVAARERALVAARETMNARITVHNQMGAVLLSTKYYLDHPESMRDTELLRLLEYNNRFLLSEAESEDALSDPLREAVWLSGRVGVTVDMAGVDPDVGPIRSLIAQAIEQCATNTVRHAGGDRLTVRITEQDGRITAVFTNNGIPPGGPIAETGGLAILRRKVTEAGGTMEIGGSPAFSLTLTLPKE